MDLEAEFGTHRLRWWLVRIKHLPAEAAVWRVQQQDGVKPRKRVERDPSRIAQFFRGLGMTK